jgi:hypothetical protein
MTAAAEPVERRAGTKGNADWQSTHQTQRWARVSQALDRMRQMIAVGTRGAPARAIIEEQDRLIAEKSGLPMMAIKSVRRSGAK